MRWSATVLLCSYAVMGAVAGATVLRADDSNPTPEQKFKEVDKDGSGKIEAAEVPTISAADFARADRDKDGGLSIAEAVRWKALDDAKKNKGQRAEWRRKFREADKDGNGVVEKGEFPAPEMLFDKLDRDGDGLVDWNEAVAFGIEEELAKLFAQHDADLSGTLTQAEIPGEGKYLVVAADQDGDGQLTGDEAYAFLRELTAEAEQQDGGPTAMGPTRPATPAEPAKGAGGVLAILSVGFDQLDKDRNERLGKDEFPAGRELLARMDVDRDGQLSRAELELRLRRAKDLGERGQRLHQRAKGLSVEAALLAVSAEGKGLFEAGRLEELAGLMDEVELWLDSRPKR